jgi:hypothetical protein
MKKGMMYQAGGLVDRSDAKRRRETAANTVRSVDAMPTPRSRMARSMAEAGLEDVADETRRLNRDNMERERMGGMRKYQEGGPVRASGKRRGMDGGQKGVPVMTQEQRRQARSMMTPEERREADAPLTARELEGMSSRYKKGGMVKKYQEGGSVSRAAPEPTADETVGTGGDYMGRAPRRGGLRSGRANANRRMEGLRAAEKGNRALADTGDMGGYAYKKGGMVKKKAGGVVKKAMGGMVGKGCK